MKALEFFSHDVNASVHPKFEHLRSRYGWAGEGQFWALNGLIAQAGEGRLDISRHFVRGTLAARFGMTAEDFMEYIRFLAEDCELVHWEHDLLWTDRVQEDLGRVEEKRARQRRYLAGKAKKAEPSQPPAPPEPPKAEDPAPEPAAPEPQRKAAKRPAREKATPIPAEPAEAQPEPATTLPAVAGAAPPAPRGEGDELYDWLWQGFLGANGDRFSNYPKEARGTKELVRQARAYAPADPQGFLKEVLATFRRLKGQDSFYQRQPFLPSVLASSGIFDRIIEAMRIREGATADSWLPEEATA